MGQHEYGWTILSIITSVRLQRSTLLSSIAFENVRQEVWEFNVDHWSFLGKAIPDAVAKWIGRRWGWHRMIYGQKPLVVIGKWRQTEERVDIRGQPFRVTYRMTRKLVLLRGFALLSGYVWAALRRSTALCRRS